MIKDTAQTVNERGPRMISLNQPKIASTVSSTVQQLSEFGCGTKGFPFQSLKERILNRAMINKAQNDSNKKHERFPIGQCQLIDKPYTRTASVIDMKDVRPVSVLRKSLQSAISLMYKPSIISPISPMLASPSLSKQQSQPDIPSNTPSSEFNLSNYNAACDLLKSIRQDLMVQHQRGSFAIEVYVRAGRLALQAGDLAEFKQCQTILLPLLREKIQQLDLDQSK
ncbi:MAG: hypothetical protein EZS28_005561 [Streblomastix strix]|uniref:Uncharacterized protein n=1 Tax=Streblomastix strix TaxID=222440 RepID=A0A5J4WV40_9EUKA|nr:MAG: hypothetical protein EZS28_005561 [Streblomastix strix]